MKILICDWCGNLHDPDRGTVCLCRTPYDPDEVEQRHRAAVEAAALSDRLRSMPAVEPRLSRRLPDRWADRVVRGGVRPGVLPHPT